MGVQELEKGIMDDVFTKFGFEWKERELAAAGEECVAQERFYFSGYFSLNYTFPFERLLFLKVKLFGSKEMHIFKVIDVYYQIALHKD